MKRRKIASLDVGTSKICTVMADTDGADLRVLGVGIAPSQGLQKGLVVNLNDAKHSIRQSVQMAEQAAGYRLESALVGITGRHINSANNRGVVAIPGNRQMVRQEDVDRVLDVAQNAVQTSVGDTTILHLIPQYYAVDGQEGIKNPVGMHGFRLDVETHIVTASQAAVENLTKCIRAAGIEIDDLIFEPLASAEAVLTEDERLNGVIMADIGGGTTGVAVINRNNFVHTSVLPVAGHSLTHDISVGLGISYELAEEIKKKYASVEAGIERMADHTLIEGGQTVPYGELYEIVRSRMEEILRLVILEVPGDMKSVRGGLVLTGGTSVLPGLTELGMDIAHMPVRLGIPPQLYGIADNLVEPDYAASVGLLMWELSHGRGRRPMAEERPRTFMSDLAHMLSRAR
ncbi:MAG: cell division protein FtsA [Dehalococcoidia bacterium]|nr:cell division protein FtsA [Dehalococcoidia bacterium]